MDEAMDQAVRVFCARGFHGTSIADLADGMGLTVGSIYKAFQDKRAIFMAALDRQSGQRNLELQAHLDEETTGRDKLRRLLMFYADLSCGIEGRLGCLVVGTAVELASFDEEIASRVTSALAKREELIAGLIRLGQKDGSVSSAVEVKPVARLMLCLLQGFRVVGKTSPAPADMAHAVESAMALLG